MCQLTARSRHILLINYACVTMRRELKNFNRWSSASENQVIVRLFWRQLKYDNDDNADHIIFIWIFVCNWAIVGIAHSHLTYQRFGFNYGIIFFHIYLYQVLAEQNIMTITSIKYRMMNLFFGNTSVATPSKQLLVIMHCTVIFRKMW